jgi:hypothetical protein
VNLQKELATYKRELPNLLGRVGKYVLIRGDQVLSVWEAYQDAIQEGYRVCGLDPFLVKQIQAVEQVHYITRAVEPVCQS